MAGEPNELPEGGEGGGGGGIHGPRGEFPAELPVSDRVSQVALVQELIRVRTRVHQIENAALVRSVLGTAVTMPDPAELPEGGEGGGFGGGIVGEFPRELPFELPVATDRLATLEQQISQLTAAVSQLTVQVKQIQR